MNMGYKILVINPGSTSTKVAVYSDGAEVCTQNLEHAQADLDACAGLMEQLPLRTATVLAFLERNGMKVEDMNAIACRGGTFGSVKGGAYQVNEALVEACRHPKTNHPSNLAAIIGYEIGKPYGIPAYIYDAVCTDEVQSLAKLSGYKGLSRRPNSHVLNTRAVCRKVAEEKGRSYEDMNFIAVHMGGGVSLNVHRHGQIIDVIGDGEGPMSPERAGRINSMQLIRWCFDGKETEKSITKKLKGQGGLLSHLGTSSMIEVEKRIQAGDDEAGFVLGGMAYQVAKGVGELSTVLKGRVDAIILTGGCAYCKPLVDEITERVQFIAPVTVIPGAMEMEALSKGVTRVLDGTEKARIYGEEV